MKRIGSWPQFVCGLGMCVAIGGETSAAVLDFETRSGGFTTASGLFNDPSIYGGIDAYNQFEQDFGVRLDVLDDNNGNNIRANNPLALYNSRCFGGTTSENNNFNANNDPDRPACTGGDPDLATGEPFDTPNEDNILIINERNTDTPQNADDIQGPDDRAAGGTVEFEFTDAGGVDFNRLVLIDLDENIATSDAIRFDFIFSDGSALNLTGADADDAGDSRISKTVRGGDGENSYRTYFFSTAVNVAQLQVTFLNVSGGIAVLNYDRPVQPVPLPGGLPLMLASLGCLWLWRRQRDA